MSLFTEYAQRPAAPSRSFASCFPRERGSARYLTFELDSGGLNNIRMQLEYLALMAAISGRTLVLPPPDAWYLINYGPMTRPGDMGRVSHHGEFFDLSALRPWINVATTAEFVTRERSRLGMPGDFTEFTQPIRDVEKADTRAGLRREWTNWKRRSFRTISWNPLFNVLFVPDVGSVFSSTQRPDANFVDGRTPVAFDQQFDTSPVVHFPCEVEAGIRQLGQIAKSFLFPDDRQSTALWSMLKHGVRYVPAVFEYAMPIISKLGLFQYSSLHLRRNDFQYEVFRTDASTTARAIDAVLKPGECIYIATDETDESFFALIEAQRPVYRYGDVIPERENETDGGPAGKLTGCVEQIVCAGGRCFLGTPHSSFSTYISRIRGYVQAPDRRNHDHTSPPDQTRQHGFIRRTIPGQAYMREDPVLWEDAGMDSPFYSVVCTDTSDYVHWQCELLEYTWKQVAQRGELIRLVSRKDGESLPRHGYAHVIGTGFSNVHPETGDWYPPYNRLFSFQEWLSTDPEPGTVLILDPDCVFRDRLPVAVPAGAPVGQRWRGFAMGERWRTPVAALSDVDPETVQPITWPALIHTDDLKALMPRWIELTTRLRVDTGAWEADMMALVVAAAELNLRFHDRHVAAVMNWPEEDERAPIIHYCQAVEAKDGSRLWFKQGYQPWQETHASPADAGLDYCGDLISILNEFVEAHSTRTDIAPALHNSTTLEKEEAVAAMPNELRVKVSLRTNATIEVDCRPGDPLLRDLFSSLAENSEDGGAAGGGMLSLPTRDNRRARFHSSQIVAIETIPYSR